MSDAEMTYDEAVSTILEQGASLKALHGINVELAAALDRVRAENAALRAEIEWPTFQEARAQTPFGGNMAKTMLRLCQAAVAKWEAGA